MNANRGVALANSILLLSCLVQAQQIVHYRLEYSGVNGSRVHVSLTASEPVRASASFVMPRNYPGGYSLVLYDGFVEDIHATSGNGKSLVVQKQGSGPRWRLGEPGDTIASIEYWIDVRRMEQELHSAVDSSKVRSGYLGILGYSVFGYLDGLQDKPIDLRVDLPKDWPILTTLSPSFPVPKGNASTMAPNYYALADSQVLAGPDLQFRSLPGKISLILAVYAEGNDDVDLEAEVARQALERIQAYFGETPFPRYTVQLELLRPLPDHEYDFSQEHLDSGTFSLSTAEAITAKTVAGRRSVALFNYAHHMAHCWIPKRAYGVGYLPFNWEMPPVIDTIWFNEGFARYAAIEALVDGMPVAEGAAFRSRQLATLRQVVDDASDFIRRLPLLVLSREASFMYSLDFRIGKNTYARGALMAAEIDDRIRTQTKGTKSLRDSLRFLLRWTQHNQRPFEVEELPTIFTDATGVEVRDIFANWLNTENK